jgi:hypothetical protein
MDYGRASYNRNVGHSMLERVAEGDNSKGKEESVKGWHLRAAI